MQWDQYFFGILEAVTAKSQDRSRRFGSLIVDVNNRILATGYNGIPRRIVYRETYHMRPDKYTYFVHAELNSIFNAAATGTAVHGASLYTQEPPCAECAKGIIQSGIATVVYRDEPRHDPKLAELDTWRATVEIAIEMFKEAQVLLRKGSS